MADLEEALEATRPAVEAALADAEAELAQLDERRAELVALIARARAVLGDTPTAPPPPTRSGERITLHDELAAILREQDNAWMTVQDLADTVNARQRYAKRDGSPVDPSQIHARASSYPTIFEKDSGRVRLREP